MRAIIRIVVVVVALVIVSSCGDPPAKAPEPSSPGGALEVPGTYVLDVADWTQRADANAVAMRWADLANQATGSDPYFGVALPDGRHRPRIDPPKPLDEMTDTERSAFEAKVGAWIRSEAEGLEETLTLDGAGTFVLTHRSTASQGGSMSLGLVHGIENRGTWTADGHALELRVEEASRPDGSSWKPSAVLRGTFQADGSLLLEAALRQWRDQPSLYRRK